MELKIATSLAEAEEDGVLILQAEIGNPTIQKVRLSNTSVGEIVETNLLTQQQTVDAIVENLLDVPEEQVEALTPSAKKLVVTDLKKRKQLIREQVNWENSRATEEEKKSFWKKFSFVLPIFLWYMMMKSLM